MKNPGLYIHIPFCLKKCSYCAFYSITDLTLMDSFIDALLREMALYQGFGHFDTVYFGGGTPSLLSISLLDKITGAIHRNFDIAKDAEWTIEANPGDLNELYCRQLREHGFNRINIGVQSMDNRILSLLGRRHSREDAVSAVQSVRAAGFTNMGLDFIYAVPGQDINACLDNLREVSAFAPEHLSCYQLTIENTTPLGEQYRLGLYTKPDEETELDFFLRISDALSRAGYFHYEVSNFSRGENFRSRHNMKYWDHTPYLGLGPAAHSFSSDRRWWNYRSVQQYCQKLNSAKKPIEGEESLTQENLYLESLSLGLRTSDGIDIRSCRQDYGHDLLVNKKFIEKLQAEKLIVIEGDHLRPTLKGMALADALAKELGFN